jgi:hypothetical protein
MGWIDLIRPIIASQPDLHLTEALFPFFHLGLGIDKKTFSRIVKGYHALMRYPVVQDLHGMDKVCSVLRIRAHLPASVGSGVTDV